MLNKRKIIDLLEDEDINNKLEEEYMKYGDVAYTKFYENNVMPFYNYVDKDIEKCKELDRLDKIISCADHVYNKHFQNNKNKMLSVIKNSKLQRDYIKSNNFEPTLFTFNNAGEIKFDKIYERYAAKIDHTVFIRKYKNMTWNTTHIEKLDDNNIFNDRFVCLKKNNNEYIMGINKLCQ